MLSKETQRELLVKAMGWLAITVFDTVLFTCRVDRVGEKEVASFLKGGVYLLASWHGRLMTYFLGPRKDWPAAMTSQSKDGEIAASIGKHGHYKVFRGSTKKGGAKALVKMERYMRNHRQAGMLSVDGPTGPRFEAKIGAAKLASNLGCPIIPVSFSGKNAFVIKSWDRLLLPRPFSHCILIYGKPIHVPKDASLETLERATRKLQAELRRITEEADAHFGIRIE